MVRTAFPFTFTPTRSAAALSRCATLVKRRMPTEVDMGRFKDSYSMLACFMILVTSLAFINFWNPETTRRSTSSWPVAGVGLVVVVAEASAVALAWLALAGGTYVAVRAGVSVCLGRD